MERLNLTPDEILNTEFKSDLRGYNAAEVDAFLDKVLEDYQIMEENCQELLDLVSTLQEENKELTNKNVELAGRAKALDLTQTTKYSSVDILKRISRLEEKVYKK